LTPVPTAAPQGLTEPFSHLGDKIKKSMTEPSGHVVVTIKVCECRRRSAGSSQNRLYPPEERLWKAEGRRIGSRWSRIHHTLIAASCVMLAWFFVMFHIAGATLNY
jgi:hypothetical protein